MSNQMKKKRVDENTSNNTNVNTNVKVENKAVVSKETLDGLKGFDPNDPKFVKEVIATSTSLEDLYKDLKDNTTLGPILKEFKRYADTVYGNPDVKLERVASMNFTLYKTIMKAYDEPNYNKFKSKVEIINKIFVIDPKRFNPIILGRFDHFWIHSVNDKMKYHTVLEFIGRVAHPNKRKAAVKDIAPTSLNMMFNDNAIQNIIRYYQF